MSARSLPPLRTLLAFEATARHLSVQRAAAELHVSPSAVSHQIRALEDRLGVRVFHRTTRSVRLTDAGYGFLQRIRVALDRLAEATREVVDAGFTDVLTVHCAPSFAPAWLMPRLGSFLARHPDIDVRIKATPDPVDFLRSDVDLEIRYGLGDVRGLSVEPLLPERIVPLANARTARQLAGIPAARALADAPLIHSERSPLSWVGWLREHRIAGVNTARGLRVDRAYLAIQAAIDGLGVALESTVFAARELRARRLVRLFPQLESAERPAHFLVTTEAHARLPKVIAFRAWLLERSRAVA